MPTVLITGASRGLGLEFARQYADDGWRVIATYHRRESVARLREISGDIHIRPMDVANPSEIEAVATDLRGEAIDVLVNNAGIHGPRDASASFGRIDVATWLDVMRVNAMAPLKVTEAFLEHVRASDQKRVVFISSRAGSIVERGLLAHQKPGGSYIYRSSKAALNAVARGLAFDLGAEGIGVLVLHPGWVKTDMGGPDATIDDETSVSGMRRIIRESSPADSGTFRNYDGEVIPW